MINALQSALSGFLASMKRADASAQNIANVNISGSLGESGPAPYSAVTVVQKTRTDSSGNVLGVQADIVPKGTPFVPAYDPGSPFADADGLVGAPNVDLAEEAVSLTIAKATAEANLAVIKTVSELTDEVIRIFDREV